MSKSAKVVLVEQGVFRMLPKPRDIKRPLHELTHWLRPFQNADDAAHELRGRILNEFGRAEYIITEMCLRLNGRHEYRRIRPTFPFLMKQKIAFLRQCVCSPPLSKYEGFGTRVLNEIEEHFSGLRMEHAHSFFEIDLLHSHYSGDARFKQLIILQKAGHPDIAISKRNTVSIDDLLGQLAVAKRHSQLLHLCQNSLIRRGIAPRDFSTQP